MKGVVFVGRGSNNIETVKEQVFAKNQLDKLTQVEAKDVPDVWFKAIGYEKREPSPAFLSEERARRQRIIIFSIILILSLLWMFIFR